MPDQSPSHGHLLQGGASFDEWTSSPRQVRAFSDFLSDGGGVALCVEVVPGLSVRKRLLVEEAEALAAELSYTVAAFNALR